MGPLGLANPVVFDVLHTLECINPECDFYAKMGGLCKFWDGYNNQQIVVIDDPGVFNVTMTDAEANAFKNVVSHGSHTVEINSPRALARAERMYAPLYTGPLYAARLLFTSSIPYIYKTNNTHVYAFKKCSIP